MDINNLWSDFDQGNYNQNTRCLQVNTILAAKYLVGPVLGQGGFGITYKGFDLNMESFVAIKEYFPVELASRDTTTIHGDRVLSLGSDKTKTYQLGLEKFVEEAQSISQYSEVPGIVSVKDFFFENETAYMVMEYIEGISLKEYLKKQGGKVSEKTALEIMRSVMEALIKVHESGVIHRDISPENIMLTIENEKIKTVKLIDFGAARMTAQNGQKSLTIILKHGYAPEEQYRTHGEQGTWTDVYAVCAVLYKMVTGKTPPQAMDRLFHDELKTIREHDVKIKKNVENAILKGLSVKRENRIQTIKELYAYLYEGKTVTNGGKRKRCLGLVGLTIVGIVGVIFAKQSWNSEKSESSEDTIVQEQLSKDMSDSIVDTISEIYVEYHPQNSIDSTYHTLLCKPDGTVEARGENNEGQCNVTDWEAVVSVKCGLYHSLGLKEDGTAIAAGGNYEGQCDVDSWENVVQIAASDRYSLGITNIGTVLHAGIYTEGSLQLENLDTWTDIKAITALDDVIVGLKYDGTIVTEGLDYEVQIAGWENVEYIFFLNYSDILVGIEDDGTVRASVLQGEDPYLVEDCKRMEELPPMKQITHYLSGVNAEGTLVGIDIQDYPELWTNMIAACISGEMIFGIKSDGTVVESYITYGNAQLVDFKDLQMIQLVTSTNFNGYVGILGQQKDGTVLYHGDNNLYATWMEQIQGKEIIDADEWSMVLADGTMIAVEDFHAPTNGVKQVVDSDGEIACLMDDGTVRTYSQSEKHQHQSAEGVKTWTDITQLCGHYWVAGLKKDGTIVKTVNGNESEYETLEMNNVKSICSESVNFMVLKTDGTVQAIDWTMEAQGTGQLMVEGWKDIVQIAMGSEHTVGLQKDGTVIATGKNSYGQCDVETWKDVISIDAQDHFTIGLTKDGELLMAGIRY